MFVSSTFRCIARAPAARELCDAITMQPLATRPAGIHEVESSNSLRRLALPVVAELELGSNDDRLRLAAADELAKGSSAEAAVLLHRALDKEKVPNVRKSLALAVARVDLASDNSETRLAAVDLIQRTGNDGFLAELQRLAGRSPALVASASSCHMLWFLSLAAKRGFVIDSYVDDAVGEMGKDAAGRVAFTRIVLRPRIAWDGGRAPGADELAQIHHEAHENCYIANSLRAEIVVEPA